MPKSLSLPIYLSIIISAIAFSVIALFLAHRFIKSEKSKTIIIRIIAGILLALAITNRVVKTFYYVNVCHFEGYTWWYVLPDTICAFCALTLSIILLIKPNDCHPLHCIVHIAFAAGTLGTFFINYFDEHPLSDPLWHATSVVAFFMHYLLLLVPLLILVLHRLKPQMKRWYYCPLTYGFMMLFGAFEVFVLHFPKDSHVFNLFTPMLESQPILTSWYIIWVGYAFGTPLFLLLYEHFIYHRKCIDILKDMIPFKK